jgi:microcin C transport system permease protein
MRPAALILILTALLSWVFQHLGWRVPVFKAYTVLDEGPITFWQWGTLLRVAALVLGTWLLLRPAAPPNPLTQKRWTRFKSIRRGYVSLLILLALSGLALLDNLIVGKQALAVSYQGNWSFPFLHADPIPGKQFGLSYDAETDYRELKRVLAATGKGTVILPLIPYSARLDTPPQSRAISRLPDGTLRDDKKGKSFTGTAYTVFKDQPTLHRRDYRVRHGQFHGVASGFDSTGTLVERIEYADGKIIREDKLAPDTLLAALAPQESTDFRQVLYPPVAPNFGERHFLGTDSSGNDIVALLYSGFQLQWAAAGFYTLFVFALGITAGCAMGYLGGTVDLLGQRLVEIWSALPFLLIIVLIRSTVTPGIVVLVLVLAAFSWMGLSYTLRGATYGERSRDYVAAARLLGAGNTRIIFRHILPNILSILVTKLPFTVEGLIAALTALDFLGFGLPPGEPSWGSLLKDGTDNMNAPWILYSAFAAIAITLILITFVGEAIREAFDPKRFTVYR